MPHHSKMLGNKPRLADFSIDSNNVPIHKQRDSETLHGKTWHFNAKHRTSPSVNVHSHSARMCSLR